MKLRTLLTGIAIIIMVGGCIPKRYEWSPDGKWMTVLSETGLAIADAEGNLLPTIIKDAQPATWFPDSRRLLVSRKIDAEKWSDVAPYFTPDQVHAIQQSAQRVAQAIAAYQFTAADNGKWDRFTDQFLEHEKAAGRDPAIYKNMGSAIALFLRDQPDAAFRKNVPADQWKDFVSLSQGVYLLEIYTVSFPDIKLSQTLMASTQSIRELRISPSGNAAIVVNGSDAEHSCELKVVLTDASHALLTVSSTAAWYPDWSPDGRDVIFARTAEPQTGTQTTLGSITRATLFDEKGNFRTSPPETHDLAGIIYNEFTRVRCLKDGRILFASVAVNLPATDGDMPEHPQLFAINPSLPTIMRLLPARSIEDIGNAAEFFEVSPDETHLSIPDTTGKVTVVELASGNVTTVQDKSMHNENHDSDLMTIPAWRNSNELTFIAPADNGKPMVTLYKITDGTAKTLSKTWPPGTIESPPAATEPATREAVPPVIVP